MRSLRQLAFAAIFILAASPAAAEPSIRARPGNWGTASVEDIQAVLGSVAKVLLPDFPHYADARIDVSFSTTGPRVLAEKSSDGAYQVLLDMREPRWDQLAYQFSHELCHIVSNYDHREVGAGRPQQWFEETVCEAVAVVSLHRLASSWEHSPPHPGWDRYGPAFEQYARRVSESWPRRSPQSLAPWYRDNAEALEANPYLRDKNGLAAAALVELLERTPRSLEAVGYLNLTAPSADGLGAYLAAWLECCPESQRPFVQQLMSLFAAT